MQQRNIPSFSLQKQTADLKEALLKSITEVIDAQQFIGGPAVKEFEQKFAQYLGVEHTVSCNSGTDALWLSLKALEIQKDTIVLTTPYSFLASASEIAAHGAHPAFVDVDEQTFNLSPEKIELWLQKETRRKGNITIHTATGMPVVGMIVVDLFGQCADHKMLKDIADTWGLWIIEDACQSVGSALYSDGKEQMAGGFGDIATHSFYPTKNLSAMGDAGACTTNNPVLAERLTRLRNHGRSTHYAYEELGINSRMDTIQAAALNVKLDHLDSFTKKRQQHAAQYKELLGNTPGVTVPFNTGGKHVYHQYGILLETKSMRDKLDAYLKEQGIGTRIFYPELLSDLAFLKTHPALLSSCPVAQKSIDTILCLPIFPELEPEDIAYVCSKIKEFISAQAAVQQTVSSRL